jgi:tetratricopeptide (TPR) repeat protein
MKMQTNKITEVSGLRSSRLAFNVFLLVSCFLILTISIFPQNEEINNRFRLAQSYEQSGDLQKAKQIYEQLNKSLPDNFLFFDALNRIYIQLKEYDNSILLLEQRIQQNPQDINLKGLLGSSYYQKGDENKAFKIWDEALEQIPQNSYNYRVIANYAIERRVFNKAIEYLSRGRKISDDNFNLSYELANLDALLMRYKNAAEEFCIILSIKPEQLNTIQLKISTYINKPEAIDPTIETIEKWSDENENINFKVLLAWLYMQSDMYDKAYNKYLEIEDQRKTKGAELFGFAQRAFKEDHFEEASKAFKRIIDDYPDSPFILNAKIGFAKTFEAKLDKKYYSGENKWKPFSKPEIQNSDEYNEVVIAYQQLIENNKNADIQLEAYYRIGLIKQRKFLDPEEAEKFFKKVIGLNLISQFTILSYKGLAGIEINRYNLSKAMDFYNMILSAPRVNNEDKNFSSLMKAKIEFWQGNFPESSKLLRDVVKNLADNNTNDAIELSLIINTTKNDSLNLLQFAKAELLAQQNKFDEAKEIYSTLIKNQNLLTIRDISLIRYAEMLIALDKLPEAIAQLKEISDLKDKNVYSDEALLLLGKVYQFGVKDLMQAQESYENLLANFPNSLYLDDARENITVIKNKTNKSL